MGLNPDLGKKNFKNSAIRIWTQVQELQLFENKVYKGAGLNPDLNKKYSPIVSKILQSWFEPP